MIHPNKNNDNYELGKWRNNLFLSLQDNKLGSDSADVETYAKLLKLKEKNAELKVGIE